MRAPSKFQPRKFQSAKTPVFRPLTKPDMFGQSMVDWWRENGCSQEANAIESAWFQVPNFCLI
jgi:hypothetical protein